MAAEPEDERGGAPGASDPLLDDVLQASTDDLRQEALAELLSDHVYWRVDRILGARFRRSMIRLDQREDVRAETLLKLVNRLHRLVRDPESEPLQNFADYVSVVTYNTFDDFVRRAYPLRTRLRNRVRYALRHDARFALWASGEVLLCGYARWSQESSAVRNATEEMSVTGGTDLRSVLVELFEQSGGPLELDAVVSRIATSYLPVIEETRTLQEPHTEGGPDRELENLQSLRHLWNEISELPLKQRIALLLSARDATGESVTQFLPVTGVATIRQIAAILEMAVDEFAELWQELPLEDSRIAVMLGVTRQQVINLRRSARDRLSRRFHKPGATRRTPS